jgi:hypothetical protein
VSITDSNPLHWSFDYNHGAQNPDFEQELIKSLHGYDLKSTTHHLNADAAHSTKLVYQILPNFHRGYQRKSEQSGELCIGMVIIEREKVNANIWNYNVRYQNTTSGEDLQFCFCCRDESYRPLHESWRVDVQNSYSDIYSELKSDGFLTEDAEVRLRINGTEINVGTVDSSLPLTCNWALFDVIPALAEKMKKLGDSVDIVLLEDLTQLRPKNRFGFLDSIQSPIQLDGYYLYGAAVLPSYWWVDAKGNVAIVSSVFETLVLKEKMGSSS